MLIASLDQLLSSSTNSGRAQGQIDSTTAHNPIMQSLSVQSNHNSQHDQHGGVIENHYQYQQEGPLDEDLAEAEFRKMFGDDCKLRCKVVLIGGANKL